jgi:hypothetical protein
MMACLALQCIGYAHKPSTDFSSSMTMENSVRYPRLLSGKQATIYKTVIMLVVSYGCETRSLTLREHSLTVFENRILREIFGPKREEVTGGWRKLHNEETHALFFLQNIHHHNHCQTALFETQPSLED